MKRISKLLFKDAFYCLLLSFVFIYLVSFVILNISFFNPFADAFKDFSFLDVYYSQKLKTEKMASDIVLVNIEHRDRLEIYELVEHLKKQNPKVIGVDIIFKSKKDEFVDSLLASSLNTSKVIVSKALYDITWTNNFPLIQGNIEKAGYSNLNFDLHNNVIRNFEGLRELRDTTHYSFSTLVAKNFLEKDWNSDKMEKLLSKEIPINYTGSLDNFLSFTYTECMALENIPVMKNKIVLLGYLGMPIGNTLDIEDKLYTPLNPQHAGKSPPDMFGVIIHANIIYMLIQQDFITKIPNWLIWFFTIIISYVALLYFIRSTKKHPVSKTLIKKIVQLLFTVLFLWLTLWLYDFKLLLKPAPIIAVMIISVELIGLYQIIVKYLNKKYKWQSYFFHD